MPKFFRVCKGCVSALNNITPIKRKSRDVSMIIRSHMPLVERLKLAWYTFRRYHNWRTIFPMLLLGKGLSARVFWASKGYRIGWWIVRPGDTCMLPVWGPGIHETEKQILYALKTDWRNHDKWNGPIVVEAAYCAECRK